MRRSRSPPLNLQLLGPYWSWLVTLLPLNMAPNLVTLTGLACVGINVLTLIWYLPGLTCTPKPVLRSLGGTFDPLFPPQNALHETTVGWVFDSVVQSAKRAFTGRTDGANEVPALSTCPPLWLYFTCVEWRIGAADRSAGRSASSRTSRSTPSTASRRDGPSRAGRSARCSTTGAFAVERSSLTWQL